MDGFSRSSGQWNATAERRQDDRVHVDRGVDYFMTVLSV